MATTLTNLPVTRWAISGFSGPQPADGTAARAAEAYAAMCAAEWVEDASPSTIPAHHADFASPQGGDAYRQTWGYDAAKRTERSACGAVCYSIRIPSAALTGSACSVSSIAAELYGDRYLECGAIVSAILSSSAAPPSFASFISASATTSAILVPDATDAGGNTIPPNKRADTSATLSLAVGASAAAWLHVCLRVADYTAVRAAWHEGGAMLDPDTLCVTFSRDVAPDAADSLPVSYTPPEAEIGDEGATSVTSCIFGSATWPSGVFAGMSGAALADALADMMDAPFVAAENVFNGHHMARLGRWPDASGTDPDGDYCRVGCVAESWGGRTFPWVCGLIFGLRARVSGRRHFTRLRFGTIPSTPVRVRVALYVADDPVPAAAGLARHSTPAAAILDWSAFFGGTASELSFAEGASLALEPLGAPVLDLSGGADGIDIDLSLSGTSEIIIAVSPADFQNLSSVRWPVASWTLS